MLIKTICFFTACLLLLFSCVGFTQNQRENLDFEKLGSRSGFNGWQKLGIDTNLNPKLFIDSNTVKSGKYALLLDKENNTFQAAIYSIPAWFEGKNITLTGYLKTEHVSGGYGGLVLRVDGRTGIGISFDNMSDRGIVGTTEWKKYSITLPYNRNATKVNIGAILTGNGRMWVDDLALLVDSIPLSKAIIKTPSNIPAEADTSFSTTSGMESIKLDPQNIQALADVCVVWGFLKYYHPSVSKGNYNWDAVLFRCLPYVLQAKSTDEAIRLIENYIEKNYALPFAIDRMEGGNIKIKQHPDYVDLFDIKKYSKSFIATLENIKCHRKYLDSSYYVSSKPGIYNPVFANEIAYDNSKYPDAGQRLLSLFRYWNVIQYYYPYKYSIGNWYSDLIDLIPEFIAARNSQEYFLACKQMISRIHDTHATIDGYWNDDSQIFGDMVLPCKLAFIKEQLIVKEVYDTTGMLAIGDVIEKIDGKSIDSLIIHYKPFVAASNRTVLLRELAAGSGYLTRSKLSSSRLDIERDGERRHLIVQRISFKDSYKYTVRDTTTGFRALSANIGYIYPASLKGDDIFAIKRLFQNKKGIVIDMRGYPAVFMPFVYGAWLKDTTTSFAKITKFSNRVPGEFIYGADMQNGQKSNDNYKGRIVIIVNARTQSQAEYTVMALGSRPNTVVIGSTTAGADGDVSEIVLPGGLKTRFTGLGIYYPDGSETQHTGINIDIKAEPSIKGVISGKDELLSEAINILNGYD